MIHRKRGHKMEKENQVKDTKDEKYEIVENIIKEVSGSDLKSGLVYIILKDKKTWYSYYGFDKYVGYGVTGDDAYMFLQYLNEPYDSVPHYYPFIQIRHLNLLVRAYLSKLNFMSDASREPEGVVPARGLKYVCLASKLQGYGNKFIVIELIDIDTMAQNINLLSLIPSSPRIIREDDILEIIAKLSLQRIFAGFSFVEVQHIMQLYHKKRPNEYDKYYEVLKSAYKNIFQPYHVTYDLEAERYRTD